MLFAHYGIHYGNHFFAMMGPVWFRLTGLTALLLGR